MRLSMACAVIALALLAGAAPVSAAWQPHLRQAASWASARQGAISFAVRTEHRRWGWAARRSVPCASVLKAMLLVSYLRRDSVRDRPLRHADRRLLEPMVRWSDNVTATRVRGIVGDAGLMALARRAGMRRFSPAPIWGLSRIDAADQASFFLHVDAYVPARHRAYALRLLRTIVPAQRWGVARERPRGWALYFKGGWGSGTGAVDHQVALLRRGRRRIALAVLTTSSPSHVYATATLRGVARRLLHGVGPATRPLGSR